MVVHHGHTIGGERALARPAIAGTVCVVLTSLVPTHLGATPLGVNALKPASITTTSIPITPVAVFGIDGRRHLATRRSSLRDQVGLLFTDDTKTACTAFCVGDRTIATAAHCLFRPTGERRAKLSEFRFALKGKRRVPSSRLAGYANGSVAQHIMTGGTALRLAPPIDASRDWALARLHTAVCRGRRLETTALSSKTIETLAAKNRILQVSFHRDFGNLDLAEAVNCAPNGKLTGKRRAAIAHDFAAPEHLVLHQCDTGGASSGSPLLIEQADGSLAVIAINVGTYVQTPLMMRDGKVIHRFKADAIANTAVTAASFETSLQTFRAARILSNPGQIRQLQSGLAELGLYGGALDGAYGPQTRNAIIDFELAKRGQPTGLATIATLNAVTMNTGSMTSDKRVLSSPSASNLEIRSNRPSVDRLGRSPFGLD